VCGVPVSDRVCFGVGGALVCVNFSRRTLRKVLQIFSNVHFLEYPEKF
jgi:hypothetical protein